MSEPEQTEALLDTLVLGASADQCIQLAIAYALIGIWRELQFANVFPKGG